LKESEGRDSPGGNNGIGKAILLELAKQGPTSLWTM
jgi:hypothetical protein